MLQPKGRAAVVVNSTPERSLFARIGTVIGQYAPARAEQLNRYASIRTLERLRQLFLSAGFEDVDAKSTTKSFSFASFDDYFSGTEAGAGIVGQEFVKLPVDTRAVVREAMRQSFPDAGSRRPFLLVGSGRR